MKTVLIAVVACFGMLGSLAAQGNTPNSSPQNSNPAASSQSNPAQPNGMRIAPGSVIPVQITKTIDAKKVKPGDEVLALVTEDLKSQNGQIVVPKNTKITGKVTEAQARNKQEKESQVGIAFDHAVTKDGADVVLPMSIQAVIARSYLAGNTNGNNNDNSSAQSSAQSMPQSPSSGGMSPGGRSPGMQQPQSASPPSGNEQSTNTNANAHPHPAVTGQTQGVLGIQNVTLAAAPNAEQGSVLSSDKNNVKLESGTLMLLRVNSASGAADKR
jgi:hypothetical protein